MKMLIIFRLFPVGPIWQSSLWSKKEKAMDRKLRTGVKARIWMLIGWIMMCITGLFFTGSVEIGLHIAITNSLIGLVFYFVYEVIWGRVKWGQSVGWPMAQWIWMANTGFGHMRLWRLCAWHDLAIWFLAALRDSTYHRYNDPPFLIDARDFTWPPFSQSIFKCRSGVSLSFFFHPLS